MLKNKKVLIVIGIAVVVTVVALVVGLKFWNYIYSPNVKVEEDAAYICIPTGAQYEDVKNIINELGYIDDIESFDFVAEKKEYPDRVLPGRYEIKNGMSNNELINLLRSGKQSPVRVSFISLRSLDLLAGKVSGYIEADSVHISEMLRSPEVILSYGFTPNTFISMFIPNTYEFYWNTSTEKFLQRMANEYKKFWNEDRLEKSQNMGLSQSEVSTLASIIEEETQKNDEKKRIAGVYVNRLKKGMILQADPTVKFAVNDFTIKRVLNKHLEVESPYNTYKYTGLPPGPICIPSIASIDAVLDYEKHNYLYFCAKDDFSGYHTFSTTLSQHNINAKKYHNALRRAGIR